MRVSGGHNEEIARLRDLLNDFRNKYDDVRAELEQLNCKYNQVVTEKERIEIKYAKVKSYIVKQEVQHEERYRELTREIQNLKDLINTKLNNKRLSPCKYDKETYPEIVASSSFLNIVDQSR